MVGVEVLQNEYFSCRALACGYMWHVPNENDCSQLAILFPFDRGKSAKSTVIQASNWDAHTHTQTHTHTPKHTSYIYMSYIYIYMSYDWSWLTLEGCTPCLTRDLTLDMNAAFWISQPLLPIYVSGKAPATNASAFVSTIGASSVQLRIWRLFGIHFATFITFGDLTASALMLGIFPLTVKHNGISGYVSVRARLVGDKVRGTKKRSILKR